MLRTKSVALALGLIAGALLNPAGVSAQQATSSGIAGGSARRRISRSRAGSSATRTGSLPPRGGW